MLYEHASGYAIFKVIGQEEIGVLLPEVQESVSDLSRFGKLVKLAAFSPFKSGTNALDNINCVSEGLYQNRSVHCMNFATSKANIKCPKPIVLVTPFLSLPRVRPTLF